MQKITEHSRIVSDVICNIDTYLGKMVGDGTYSSFVDALNNSFIRVEHKKSVVTDYSTGYLTHYHNLLKFTQALFVDYDGSVHPPALIFLSVINKGEFRHDNNVKKALEYLIKNYKK